MSELFCWYPGIINNKLNRNCTYYEAAFSCRGSGDMYKPHELYSCGLSMSLFPLYKSKEGRCGGEGWNLHGTNFIFCLAYVSTSPDKPCPCLCRSLLWDEWTSTAEKFILWKMLGLGHWNYSRNILLKNRGETQLKWKTWGEVYLWLIKNDNLYFVCVNFFFLKTAHNQLSSVLKMLLAFFNSARQKKK